MKYIQLNIFLELLDKLVAEGDAWPDKEQWQINKLAALKSLRKDLLSQR